MSASNLDSCAPGWEMLSQVCYSLPCGEGFGGQTETDLCRFSEDHGFRKPNDDRALRLMNCCAESVLRNFSDVIIGYGHSDEFSFVFNKSTNLFKRRAR